MAIDLIIISRAFIRNLLSELPPAEEGLFNMCRVHSAHYDLSTNQFFKQLRLELPGVQKLRGET